MSSEDTVTNLLSSEERDTISEISLVSLGAAASTLGLLLGTDVDVSSLELREYGGLPEMDEPFGADGKVLVGVQYVKGLQSTTLLVLRTADAIRLTDAMMGPSSSEGADSGLLDEMQTGALSELMNQILNASATGLASLLHEAVEISSPNISPYTLENMAQTLPALQTEPLLVNRLQWLITGAEPIEMWEIRLIADVKTQVETILLRTAAMDSPPNASSRASDQSEEDDMTSPMASSPQSPSFRSGGQAEDTRQVDPVTVRPVQFSSFDQQQYAPGEENKNLALVMDVTLNLSVELGKTELSIKEVLELTRGSVIELERVAGEPVDLMANGKLIAKGEVVVIEDNFGLRITSIVAPAERLKGL